MRAYIVFLCLLAYVGCLSAQEYKEGLLYEVTGPVRKVKIKSENPFLQQKKIDFTENGRGKLSMTFFDSEGYPLGYEMNYGKKSLSMVVTYDSLRRVENTLLKNTLVGNMTLSCTIEYADKTSEPAVVRYSMRNKKEETESVCTFSDYVYDDRGNWISRKVAQTISSVNTSNSKTKEAKEEYVETRVITYYN